MKRFAPTKILCTCLVLTVLVTGCNKNGQQADDKLKSLTARVEKLENPEGSVATADRITSLESTVRQLLANTASDRAGVEDLKQTVAGIQAATKNPAGDGQSEADAAKNQQGVLETTTAKIASLNARVDRLEGARRATAAAPKAAAAEPVSALAAARAPQTGVGNLTLVGFDVWGGAANAVFSRNGQLVSAAEKQQIDGYTIDTIDTGARQITLRDAAGNRRTLIQKVTQP